MPAQQARVGNVGGGSVRQLSVSAGGLVNEQQEIARVDGPSGSTEVVTAPFRGTVTNILVHAGDTLLPGAAIAIVADLRTLQVETSDVDEFLVGHVQVGQPVRVTVDALDNLELQGTVRTIAGLPQTDTSGGGQNYPVLIALNGVPTPVRAGMSIRVTFPD
jgi:multidrug efflux pump subunit AcrA (membrane-fusion protein)